MPRAISVGPWAHERAPDRWRGFLGGGAANTVGNAGRHPACVADLRSGMGARGLSLGCGLGWLCSGPRQSCRHELGFLSRLIDDDRLIRRRRDRSDAGRLRRSWRRRTTGGDAGRGRNRFALRASIRRRRRGRRGRRRRCVARCNRRRVRLGWRCCGHLIVCRRRSRRRICKIDGARRLTWPRFAVERFDRGHDRRRGGKAGQEPQRRGRGPRERIVVHAKRPEHGESAAQCHD